MKEIKDLGDKCPVCDTKWKVTAFGTKVWKDCVKCNEKAEVLVNRKEELPEVDQYDSWATMLEQGFESSGLWDDDEEIF